MNRWLKNKTNDVHTHSHTMLWFLTIVFSNQTAFILLYVGGENSCVKTKAAWPCKTKLATLLLSFYNHNDLFSTCIFCGGNGVINHCNEWRLVQVIISYTLQTTAGPRLSAPQLPESSVIQTLFWILKSFDFQQNQVINGEPV